MERVRERSQRGFGHAIVFFVVVVLVALMVVAIAGLAQHSGAINTGSAASAVGPSIVSVNGGSGIAVAPHEVVTAAHLVDGSDTVTVAPNGKASVAAAVAGYDRATDVALLVLPSDSATLTPAPTSDSATLRKKNAVVALGSTGPTRGTVKTVSNSDLTIDAPLRDAVVGGAVVDKNDDVVALIRRVETSSTSDALPWNAVVSIVNTIDGGRSTSAVHVGPRASLGITVVPLAGSPGARVTAVQSGGPASSAGIATGDVIASVNGVAVSSQPDLDAALDPVAPGASIPVAVFDAHGVLHTLPVVTR
jgi:S1-C subfamily serine protease